MIRARDNQKGAAATRHHAEAMKIDYLDAIIKISESVAPPERILQMASSDPPDSAVIALRHGMMRAFLSSGFTLWTR